MEEIVYKINWICTIKRMLFTILMALLAIGGFIYIDKYKQPIGWIIIFIAIGLFFYKLLTWKSIYDIEIEQLIKDTEIGKEK